ncbi:SlyX family protein [Litoribrevibacter albus]|uniref:Protein SlyX homolog n=1 Tax=Litoribrevibacter albus TaxID=1473156 RepID=A0AA37W5H1_9GAMM|nr:SlyX family protein [Litoribrevibacter albus]GLQ31212.1 protein SlyX [Litoribrevibacter albus]
MSSKVEDLETRLAFQEDTLETINKIVIEQQKEIEKLHSYIRILKDKISSVESSIPLAENDAPPPHY